MNIRFLETAIALAHHRSFKRTAEQMHCTQAAVSNRVAALEEELGTRLFDRRFRDVAATPEGERFVAGARDIVQRYQALVAQLRPDTGTGPPLRVGLNSSMAFALLPDIREAHRCADSSWRLDIATDAEPALLAALGERTLDACLTLLPDPVGDGLQAHALFSLSMCWVGSPLLVMDAQRRFAPRDLAAFPIITTSTGGPVAQGIRRFVGLGTGRGTATLASNSVASTVHMALQGAGITLIPEAAIQHELRAGLLVKLDVAPAYPALHYAILVRARTRGAEKTAATLGCTVIRAAAERFCARADPALAELAPASNKFF